MKAVLMSDTHFGDPTCALVKPGKNGEYVKGEKFDAFLAAAGKNNKYLIMIGDVFDFSIVSYQEAYKAAKKFFELILDEGVGLLEEHGAIIYQPGNHDFSFWHWVMHEVSAVRPISDEQNGGLPKPGRFAVPGILDLRSKGSGIEHVHLHGVDKQDDPHQPYGGLFLDHLTNKKIPFYVVYPNLYLLTDTDTVLVTHGQYWDTVWGFVSEYWPSTVGGDLRNDDNQPLDHPMKISDLVALNFPLNVFMSSAIGQAGPFTRWVKEMQSKAEGDVDKTTALVMSYIKNLMLARKVNCLVRLGVMLCLRGSIKSFIRDMVANKARGSSEYPSSEGQLRAFRNYFNASLNEITEINASDEFAGDGYIPRPNRLIFGHTHEPVSWAHGQHNKELELLISNSGGWLYRGEEGTGEGRFVGAELFLIGDGTITSIAIR